MRYATEGPTKIVYNTQSHSYSHAQARQTYVQNQRHSTCSWRGPVGFEASPSSWRLSGLYHSVLRKTVAPHHHIIFALRSDANEVFDALPRARAWHMGFPTHSTWFSSRGWCPRQRRRWRDIFAILTAACRRCACCYCCVCTDISALIPTFFSAVCAPSPEWAGRPHSKP